MDAALRSAVYPEMPISDAHEAPTTSHWTDRFGGAAGRLVASVVFGVTISFLEPTEWSWTLHVLSGWCGGAATYLFMAWLVVFRANADATKRRCRLDDSSRGIVDMLLTTATVASVGAVGLALHHSESGSTVHKAFGVGIPILSVVLGWLLVHTLYALHYANLFYHNDEDECGPPAGGIDFHEDAGADPDYRDFLYLSFSIATTSGVTDVELTSKAFRRTVNHHSVLAFAFNTIVLALSVNVITNLLSGG